MSLASQKTRKARRAKSKNDKTRFTPGSCNHVDSASPTAINVSLVDHTLTYSVVTHQQETHDCMMSHEALVDATTTAAEFHQPADHALFIDSPIDYMIRKHVTAYPCSRAGATRVSHLPGSTVYAPFANSDTGSNDYTPTRLHFTRQ